MKRTIIIECPSCKGTGLHKCKSIGSTQEFNEAAIECNKCKGTGSIPFTYNVFNGIKNINGVTRVFPYCPHGGSYYNTKDSLSPISGKTLHFSSYGCSYEDWKKGVKPSPMEEKYCPFEYCSKNTLDFEKAPFPRCKKIDNYCTMYGSKDRCWEEWHKNND